ncbi:MAG: xyloglucanase, partial [Acidobacteriota bacterium]|nr:xyloglucanase [Acidobacteriota bacterium]
MRSLTLCSIVLAGWGLGAWLLGAQTPPLQAITQPPASIPYEWRNVVIRGGGFVTGILFHPSEKGLVYTRTDVGGAYRSDDSGEHWVPLTDQFGREDATYLGIESLAIDPEDASKLYLAAGMYSGDWGGQSAILRSNDRGRTFARTPMPFKMGGNDNGRGCGERLAVDPDLGSVLFFGSRKAGLWRSSDSGATWAHVDSFPVQNKVPGPGAGT